MLNKLAISPPGKGKRKRNGEKGKTKGRYFEILILFVLPTSKEHYTVMCYVQAQKLLIDSASRRRE